jgi:hypothetical protein
VDSQIKCLKGKVEFKAVFQYDLSGYCKSALQKRKFREFVEQYDIPEVSKIKDYAPENFYIVFKTKRYGLTFLHALSIFLQKL